MKKNLIIVLAVGIAAIASIGLAQDEHEYQSWMKGVASTNGSLKKNIEAKSGDAAAADAEKLAGIFKQVTAFWEKKGGAPDAVAAAQKAEKGASDAAAGAKAGNWDQASAGAAAVGSTCMGCHMAHRERGPDGFKIK